MTTFGTGISDVALFHLLTQLDYVPLPVI